MGLIEKNVLFKNIKYVFDSDLFKEFTAELIVHTNETEDLKNTSVDDILLGILYKLDQCSKATTNFRRDVDKIYKNASINIIDTTVKKVTRGNFGSCVASHCQVIINFNHNLIMTSHQRFLFSTFGVS